MSYYIILRKHIIKILYNIKDNLSSNIQFIKALFFLKKIDFFY